MPLTHLVALIRCGAMGSTANVTTCTLPSRTLWSDSSVTILTAYRD